MLDSCTVLDNNAANSGGTLLLASSEVWLINSKFLRNSAPNGGVLTGQSGSIVHILGAEMTHNLASLGGQTGSRNTRTAGFAVPRHLPVRGPQRFYADCCVVL